MVSTYDLSDRTVITCIQTFNKTQHTVRISSRLDIGIGTGSDQRNRNKTSTKMNSTGKVKDVREANTSNNQKIGHTMLILH